MNSNASHKTIIRPGYPLSSDEMNQTIEHFLYDIASILSTPMPNFINYAAMDEYFGGTGYSAAYMNRLNQEKIGVYKVKDIMEDEYTTNWRLV